MKLAIAMTISLAAIALTSAKLSAQDKSPANPKPVWSVVEGNRLKLWRAGIAAPTDDKESAAMKELVSRIEAMNLRKVLVPAELLKPVSPVAAAAEATSQPTSQPTSRPTVEASTATSEKTASAPAQSKLLEKVSRLDPSTFDSPSVMAEALFLADQQAAAARFYEAAAENETDGEERAWLLFQAANCRRKEDTQASLKLFKKLIDEHAESIWATIARRQKAIIEWQEETNLSAMLEEARRLKPR